MSIMGKSLKRDVAKGSDIEITVSMSETRDLMITAYLNMADQEFRETFNPRERHTPVDVLKEEVADLAARLDAEIADATEKEDYETAAVLTKLKREMESIDYETERLTTDDVTDKRYQLEDRKRKIAQEFDMAIKHKRLQKARAHYFEQKAECLKMIDSGGNDHERRIFNEIVSQEETFLSTNSVVKIQERSDELYGIILQIRWRMPNFLTDVFNWLLSEQVKMNDQVQARSLTDAGRFALESKNWGRLKEVNYGLLNLLPKASKQEIDTKIGFGL
jgi:molecular chaperone DnaK